MEKTHLRRNKALFIAYCVVITLLMGRVAFIQIISHEELEQAAISQYEIVIENLDTRGIILDRNYRPLTGGTNQYYYFIRKEKEDKKLENIILDLRGRVVSTEDSSYLVFRTEDFKEKKNALLKEEYGAYVFRSQARYADDQIACHLVGYINQDEKIGVSGLELLYQEKLKETGDELSLWADAGGNIIRGQSPKVLNKRNNSFDGNYVVTTIDRRLQYISEKALESDSKKGAVIVMNAKSGELLAMASSPTFNPNDIQSYLAINDDCLINKSNQGAYPPGSVFKIVTALAALEAGVSPEKEIECTGSTNIGGVELNCQNAKEGGHGLLNMKEAMAISCNCYFAELGKEIGVEVVIKQAEDLGFGKAVLENYPEETSGNLPNPQEVYEADTSNISIGQGEVLVTPLQIAQMTSIIANDGKYVKPSIELGKGKTKIQLVSKKNAIIIQDMLKEVMVSGTAKGNWKNIVGGKTGTAETGDKDEYCCWFTGYCKNEEALYVITVMVEGGRSGTADALPVFEDIVEYLNVIN